MLKNKITHCGTVHYVLWRFDVPLLLELKHFLEEHGCLSAVVFPSGETSNDLGVNIFAGINL